MLHITAMKDDFLLSETNVEGTSFDADYYWRWIEAQRVGLWQWQDWETALMYRDWPPNRKAAPHC